MGTYQNRWVVREVGIISDIYNMILDFVLLVIRATCTYSLVSVSKSPRDSPNVAPLVRMVTVFALVTRVDGSLPEAILATGLDDQDPLGNKNGV